MRLALKYCAALVSGLLESAYGATLRVTNRTIQVNLWDQERRPGFVAMGIRVSSRVVAAGTVTFEVTNRSKTMVHGLLISPNPGRKIDLPYLASSRRVDEGAAINLAEIASLGAGKYGLLTLTLAPGYYVLYCNAEGRYASGMRQLIRVQ